MNAGQTIFAQLLAMLPFKHFEYLVGRMNANRWTRHFGAWSHFVCLVYAQLTRREGLRDLVACLNSHRNKLYHLGIRQRVTRSTLSDANERRSYLLFERFAQRLVEQALDLYRDHDLGLGLKEPLYAMDSTTIDLCLSLFPWAHFRQTKAAVKAHTVLDLRGSIPVMISITTGKVHDVKLLDMVQLPTGSIVVLDRGYVAFKPLYRLVQRGCSFVVRAKDNLAYTLIANRDIDISVGVQADQLIRLSGYKSHRDYPRTLRRIAFHDQSNNLDLVFLTNRQDLSALTVAQIYKQRWQIELFFRWLKQHLSVKHFFGNNENAVKSQIWIAICTYLMVLIAHKQHAPNIPLHTFIHLIEANVFEHITIKQMVAQATSASTDSALDLQQELFS